MTFAAHPAAPPGVASVDTKQETRGMRRISTATRNRKRERDRDRRRRAKADTAVEVVVPSAFYDPFQLTTCSICGGIEDEDLIILCDGPGCSNEVHMYCMTPVMTKVPEGDWFCEACDKVGTTKALLQYFENFAATTKDLSPASSSGYLEFVVMLQQRHVPLELWKPTAEDVLVANEFDPSSADLIGGLLRLSISESQHHTGRIINRRFDTVHEKWEHLVQFKSGIEGRNEPLTHWFCLSEHACLVGGTVKWARIPDFPWWPAVEFYQSGMEKVARKYREDQPNVTNANRRADKQPADEILHYFFGDASYALISRTDSRYVVPFFAKSREARIYSAKRLNVAYALACLEREEMLATRRAFNFMDAQQEQRSSILVDGYTTATLKALADLPTSFNSALQTARASTGGPGAVATSSAVRAGAGAEATAASVWELYCKYNQRMLQHEYCLPSDPGRRQLVLDASAQDSVPAATDGTQVDWAGQPRLCLDRVYLSAELGIDIRAPHRKVLFHPPVGSAVAVVTESSVPSNGAAEAVVESGAAIDGPEETSSKRRRVSNSRYANDAAESTSTTTSAVAPPSNINAEPAASTVTNKSSGPLVINPFSLSDVIFQKFRQEAIRKQDEIIAQQAQEEQERLERNAARKARQSELAANPNPWVADGEDFTRKSSRLSTRAPSSLSECDAGGDNHSSAVQHGGKQVTLSAGGSSSSSVLENETQVSAATTTVAPKRSTRRSRKRIQEEEAYKEFLESSANQPRLLTDLDRDAWVGAVVTYLPTMQKGRVTEYRSGWAIIRTLEGSLNCRPYQLEVVETESEDMAQFEEAEMWALCGEGEGAGEGDGSRKNASSQYSSVVMGQAPHPSHPLDYSQSVDEGFPGEEDAMLVDSPDMYFDESDLMYEGFANDQEYDALVLRQFDIGVNGTDEHDATQGADGVQQLQQARSASGAPKMSRAEIQAIRLQQQKPSRTKLIDILPAQSEAEKKRKLDALFKSRLQVQQLLRPPAAASSTSPRSITINRTAELTSVEDIGAIKSFAGAPATTTKDRCTAQVTKLGTAATLAKPSFLRGFGNNWRRPTAEPVRRLSISTALNQSTARSETALPRADHRTLEASTRSSPSQSIGDANPIADSTVGRGGAGKSQQLTSAQETQREAALQALRDPRLRARLERTLPPAPTAAPPRSTTENVRALDAKNSSSASRAMRANIEYLQAGLSAPSEPPKDRTANPATTFTTRRAVTFTVKHVPSSISGALMDADVLELTDAADMAQFSPNESDSDDASSVEAETIRFSIRAVDEMERAVPTAQRMPRPTVTGIIQGHLVIPSSAVVVAHTGLLEAAKLDSAATAEQPRRSRFGAVQLATMAVVPQLDSATEDARLGLQPSVQVPPSIFPIQEHSAMDHDLDEGYGCDYPDIPLSKAERRRQKRHAAARAKHHGSDPPGDPAPALTAVTAAQQEPVVSSADTTADVHVPNKAQKQRDDLEPGEVEDDNDLESLPDEPPPPPQQFLPTAPAATLVAPPLKRSSSALERLMLSYKTKSSATFVSPRAVDTAVTSNAEFRPLGMPNNERITAPLRWQLPMTTPMAALPDVAAVAAALATRSSTATNMPRRKMHINLDQSYPQFNHLENAHLAIAHMDEVMPLSMSNLTTLLTGSDFFPPMGYVRDEHFPPVLVQDARMFVEQERHGCEVHDADRQYRPLTESGPGGYPPHMELPAPAFTHPVYQHPEAFGQVPREEIQPRRSRFTAASRLSGQPEAELAQLAQVASSPHPRPSRFSAPVPAYDEYSDHAAVPLFAQPAAYMRESNDATGFRRDDMQRPGHYAIASSAELAYSLALNPHDQYTTQGYSNQYNTSFEGNREPPRDDRYPTSSYRQAPNRDMDTRGGRPGGHHDGRQRSRWGRN